jgi:hypothetical protein
VYRRPIADLTRVRLGAVAHPGSGSSNPRRDDSENREAMGPTRHSHSPPRSP